MHLSTSQSSSASRQITFHGLNSQIYKIECYGSQSHVTLESCLAGMAESANKFCIVLAAELQENSFCFIPLCKNQMAVRL